jgi:hypothetical protein
MQSGDLEMTECLLPINSTPAGLPLLPLVPQVGTCGYSYLSPPGYGELGNMNAYSYLQEWGDANGQYYKPIGPYASMLYVVKKS